MAHPLTEYASLGRSGWIVMGRRICGPRLFSVSFLRRTILSQLYQISFGIHVILNRITRIRSFATVDMRIYLNEKIDDAFVKLCPKIN